jgi:simple sugar transport system substrate-binding protein
MIRLAPLNPSLPAELRNRIAGMEKQIADGSLHPFAGPVVDQDGKTRVAAGATMSDGDLSGMDYYVQGVVSKLSK